MAKVTRFADLDVSHLGPDATEQELMEFLDYARDLEAKYPELTQEEIMDRLFGHDGDWVRHARELGVDVDAYRATTEIVTLNDYANERSDVVLFWASVGTPAGDYTPLGHPDLDFADRRGLLDLTGTVDEEGDWRWDGVGTPTDDRGNSITKLHAYVDPPQWAEMVEEYGN